MTDVKRRDVLALGVVTIALAGCGSSGGSGATASAPPPSPAPAPAPTPSPPPPPVTTLTVNDGIQAATQLSGATREVFANVDPAGQVFDRWSGDTAVLLNASERQTGVQALTASATVTALYKTLANFTFTQATLAGSAGPLDYYYYFPQPLPTRGVVFRFHGSGGSARAGTTRVEEVKFNRDLAADGYAVVTLDSDDRVNKQWNNSTINTGNIDVVHVQQVIAALTALGLVNASTRYFAQGHSNGGGFAPLVGSLLGWRAAHISCASGNGLAITQQSTLPAIWTIAQNDTTIGASGNANAQTNYQSLSSRGIAAQLITFVPSAVYSSRFMQIPGLSATDSQVIYNSIRAANLLDLQDFQLSAPNQTTLTAAIPASYAPYASEIANLLRMAYAEHEFSAAASARVRAFFAAREA